MLLPVVNLGVMWGMFGIYSLYWWANYSEYPETKYLKANHPEIWKKLHPWGDFSINSFATLSLVFGRYDDGTDYTLNEIKLNRKANLKMLAWIFLLVPVSWLLNIGSLLMSRVF
jgi:hypothetical protein